MRENVVVRGLSEKSYRPKVLIARSILGLSTSIIYPLFLKSELHEHGDERELEEFRAMWLRWLNRTSRTCFLSYLDSYYAFLEDLAVGNWCPVENDLEPARHTALNALGGLYNRRSLDCTPVPPDFS